MFKNPDKAPKSYTPLEALPKIAAFCAYQERTHKEVAEKLKSYGLDEDEAGEIIIRLSREKLLDEERYAQAYARGKHRTNGWGRRRIRMEIKELDGDEYYDKLKQLLGQRDAREKETHPMKRKLKLSAYLIQKGYESDLIQLALGELGEE
jgi:regulatory protein